MKTAQVQFDDIVFNYLKKESKLGNKSISEIVNNSIHVSMQQNSKNLLSSLDSIFGIWKDKSDDVNDYIRDLRKDR